MDDRFAVLFLCTGNSARSVLAEAALARRGGDRFVSYSAGSDPKPAPHPLTIETLERQGYDTAGYRSKSWDEFAGPDAPPIDLVITVCSNAAGETCPVWSGAPMTAHWGVEDPAAFSGPRSEALAFFQRIHDELARKIDALIELDLRAGGAPAVQERIRALADR